MAGGIREKTKYEAEVEERGERKDEKKERGPIKRNDTVMVH